MQDVAVAGATLKQVEEVIRPVEILQQDVEVQRVSRHLQVDQGHWSRSRCSKAR